MAGDFDPSGRITLEDGPYRGFLEHVPIRGGLSLFRTEGQSDTPYVVSAPGGGDADNLVLGCIVSGIGVLEAQGSPDQLWRDSGQIYAVSIADRIIRYHLQPEETFRSVALMLTPEGLDELARDHDLPELARRRCGPISAMRAAAPLARKVANDLLNPTYAGPMQRLYREGKSVELLALQLGLLATGRESELTSQELRRVREARELLASNLQEPPDLHTLAAAVGLRTKRLNQGFRELYGTTVFDLLLDMRMSAARDMLDQGLDMPLKQLAWALGYRQSSNFISAFRRRFGVSPGAYRSRPRD
ncbi:helix-turn-helix transcriptional regulator [Devosia sediminis]|uniref:Helix-turn-helix transcriptional regulator n=1 Tax=Devosia sediminis TaxID=2798801 RepID=A0A934IMP4_9HYPH|nr:AraC family transcriptional regulator [Devosia sediminis]MBJ3783503.1 helix-turn-helix transcriptional regulator [Devosia sediminis]